MKKALSVFLAIVMAVSLLSCFALNTAAATSKDTTVFKVPKTSSTPRMDGNVDSCYRQIFKMKGSEAIGSDGKPNELYPLDGNKNSTRYDAAAHPNREDSDWWNCQITGYAAWDATYLYLIVEVKGAGQLDDNPDANWAADGIQLAVFKGTADSGNVTDYSFAQNGGNIVAACNLGNTLGSSLMQKNKAYDTNKYGRTPTGFIKVSDAAAGNYTYELALEWSALGIKPSDAINFNCSINLNDENMNTDGFCGFQVSKGIFNETDQATKSGMAYAAAMVFEGEGGNSSASNGGGSTSNGGGTTSNGGGTTSNGGGSTSNGGGNTSTGDGNTTTGDNNGSTGVDTPVTGESSVITDAKLVLAAAEQAVAELESNSSYDADAVAGVKAAFEEFAAALNAEVIDETEVAALQKAYQDAYAALTGAVEEPDVDNKEDEKKDDDKKDDKKDEPASEGANLTWLWIVILVVGVVAAAAAIVFFVVCKGDVAKLKALFGKKQ